MYNETTYNSLNAVTYDLGLRKFMLQVYSYMTLALAISGLVSLGVSMSPEAMSFIWGTPFKWVAIFAPLLVILTAKSKPSKNLRISTSILEGFFIKSW